MCGSTLSRLSVCFYVDVLCPYPSPSFLPKTIIFGSKTSSMSLLLLAITFYWMCHYYYRHDH